MHAKAPRLKSLFPFTRAYKILNFHLFKLAQAEDKVAGRDLVAESLPYLRKTERKFWVERVNNVLKVNEHAACGFWTTTAVS